MVTEQVENRNIRDPRAVGFALGDVSRRVATIHYSAVLSQTNLATISALAYAIWREQHFVERFSMSELQSDSECVVATFGEDTTR